jgi:hypothetical protein
MFLQAVFPVQSLILGNKKIIFISKISFLSSLPGGC